MDDQEIHAILKQQEELWQKQSEDLLKGYVSQYNEMAKQAMKDMQDMITKAQKQTAKASEPAEIHMRWMEVEGQNVLIMSERAGKEILGAFDVIAKLVPELQKLLKGKRR